MDKSNEDLDRLVTEYKAGSEEAAQELFANFSLQMATVASKVAQKFHTPSAIDVEAAVNSGFRSFFSEIAKPNFDSRGGKIGGLLATIVYRKALVRIRKLKGKPIPIQHENQILDFLISEEGNQYSEDELHHDIEEVLQPILSELTDKEQTMIVAILNPNEDRSFDELSTEFKTTRSTLDQLWKTVQTKVRQHLKR